MTHEYATLEHGTVSRERAILAMRYATRRGNKAALGMLAYLQARIDARLAAGQVQS